MAGSPHVDRREQVLVPTAVLSARVSNDTLQNPRRIARSRGIPLSHVVNEAIDEHAWQQPDFHQAQAAWRERYWRSCRAVPISSTSVCSLNVTLHEAESSATLTLFDYWRIGSSSSRFSKNERKLPYALFAARLNGCWPTVVSSI